MKKTVVLLGALLAAEIGFGATVKKPSIQPRWSGAQSAEWTMDYKTALAQAKDEFKWSIMLFGGAWWCPHCQPLESNVFDTVVWKDYAARRDFYEIQFDYMNRNGDGYFCWLWEAGFQSANGLTPEQATEAIIERLKMQDKYAKPVRDRYTVQTNINHVVSVDFEGGVTNSFKPYTRTPKTVYRRIGYPTIVLIGPDGEMVDHISASVDGMAPDVAFAKITNRIETLIATCGKGTTTVSVDPDCETMGKVTPVRKFCPGGTSPAASVIVSVRDDIFLPDRLR